MIRQQCVIPAQPTMSLRGTVQLVSQQPLYRWLAGSVGSSGSSDQVGSVRSVLRIFGTGQQEAEKTN